MNKVGVATSSSADLDRAERFYKTLHACRQNFASAANNVGTVEYEKRHYGKSIGFYHEALDLRVDMAPIYANLAYAYIEDKKYPEAMAAFGKAVAIDPSVLEAKGGENGTVIQQGTATDPGLFYFFVANPMRWRVTCNAPRII